MKKRQPLKRFVFFPVLVIALMMLTAHSYAFDISIDVSPNVLNILSKSQVVTVHTDIAYNAVVGSSVYLNGVAIKSWKADDRGNFVAKFWSNEVKTLDGLIIGDYNNLTMTGYTIQQESFIGSQEILVIENVPAGKN